MEENKYGMIIDGKMDEALWATAEEHTGFRSLATRGGQPVPVQTSFKVLSFADRIVVGIKCDEPELAAKKEAAAAAGRGTAFSGNSIEVFFSPSGSNYEFYQFIVNMNGGTYNGSTENVIQPLTQPSADVLTFIVTMLAEPIREGFIFTNWMYK